MKFDKKRSLSNNVFATKFVRVEEDDQDCVIKEARLEDDFGFVEIQIGGTFQTEVTESAKEFIAFSLKSQKVQLKMGTEISYSCNAKEEVTRTLNGTTLSATKVAELKCKTFEIEIEKRIALAVEQWKEFTTSFETEVLDPITICLETK